MYPEEAHTFFSLLVGVRNQRILNFCAEGERQQPHIWTSLLGPLTLRGNEIVNRAPGQANDEPQSFDVALFPATDGPVDEARAALAEIERALAPDGLLVASAPGELEEDAAAPEDALCLPTVDAWKRFLGPEWQIETFMAAPVPGSASSKRQFTSIVKAWRGRHDGDRRTMVLTSSRKIPIVSEDEYQSTISEHWNHFERLEEIVVRSGARLEGNCFYQNMTLKRLSGLLPKQRNLFSLARVSRRILEIGFNAGHSALLFLLANPDSEITCFDLYSHAYALPCFRYLDESFPGRLRRVQGHSNTTVAAYRRQRPTFDLFHVDGGHQPKVAHTDFVNCRRLAAEDSIVIWDDVTIPILERLWEGYVRGGFVLPFEMLPTPASGHVMGTFSRLDAHLYPDLMKVLA